MDLWLMWWPYASDPQVCCPYAVNDWRHRVVWDAALNTKWTSRPYWTKFMELSSELLAKFKNVGNLPSPPNVATEIINLAQDPELEMDKIAAAISKDPVLTTKILKIANSALYARRRQSANLGQAILVLGLNATVTLSLSFSLVTSLSRTETNGVNFTYYWRRSLMNAVAARALAQHFSLPHREELFLAGLLQDLGMLAIDKVDPTIYGDSESAEDDHSQVIDSEIERLATDHAQVGAWLLSQWNIPEALCRAVGASHDPGFTHEENQSQAFCRCVALSGLFSDVLLSQDQTVAIMKLTEAAEKAFEMDRVLITDLLAKMMELIPDTEAIFEVDIIDGKAAEGIMDQAREILMIRNLQSLREVNSLKETAETLENRTQELEAENKRDALTGLYNRSHLDQVLDKEFQSAKRNGWPLTIAFVDIDFFKKVNDTYGHSAGDSVLRNAAKLLEKSTRDTDVVARYGGEEFVVLLIGNDAAQASVVCNRIVNAFREAKHDIGDKEINVTVSIGIAALFGVGEYQQVQQLVDAADQALYRAKQTGRNRALIHGAPEVVEKQQVS